MRIEEFENWATYRKIKTYEKFIEEILHIEKYEGDIDDLYDFDKCEKLKKRFTYSESDKSMGKNANHNVPIDTMKNNKYGEIFKKTKGYKLKIDKYIKFREMSDIMSIHASKVAKYICKINKEVVCLKKKSIGIGMGENLISYRGESRDFGKTKLQPSIFREPSSIKKELLLFELLVDYKMVDRKATNIEKAIDSQHHAQISRMLDITFNSLYSLYFACYGDKAADEEDGVVYVFGFPSSYSPHSNYIEDYYDTILDGKIRGYPKNFKVFTHCHYNERITAQNGGFIFFVGDEFHTVDKCYYKEVRISSSDKSKIKKELEVLFNITKATIFPEKENKIVDIKKVFRDTQYVLKKETLDVELATYFERLEYELHNCDKNSKDIMRLLRKEELDLISFTKKYSGSEEAKDKVDEINMKFDKIRIKYRRWEK